MMKKYYNALIFTIICGIHMTALANLPKATDLINPANLSNPVHLATEIGSVAMNHKAASFHPSHYSPYADITLNVHWDSQTQNLEPVNLAPISQQTGIKSYHLAFITDAGACNPAWGAQATYSVKTSWGKNLTDKLRSNGISYIVSFGGASGFDISKACTETQLFAAYEQVINTYEPIGLDFDIENGTADVAKIMLVLKKIQAAHPNLKLSFTLPVLPEGLAAPGQDVVNQAKAAGLNFAVNIMAMDYGPAYAGDMGQYAIQAANNLFTFLKNLYPQKADAAIWKMIEVTPMIGVNDVNIEQFTLANADALRTFAKQNNLGGLSIWSIARDNPCADTFASTNCSGNNLQSKPYEFSEHFLRKE